MPLPHTHAARVASSVSMSMPACAHASSEAAMAYCTNSAKRRASFFDMPHAAASKFGTSAASDPANSDASKRVMGAMHCFPE